MDSIPIVDAEIVQSTELARTSINLPAPIPVPTLPIHERLLNAGEPFARIASDALGRVLAYRRQSRLVSVLIVVGALEAVAIVWLALGAISGPVGAVTVTSEPVGARLLVDGTPSGETPTTLKLLEGLHTLEVRSAGPSEVLALNVSQGMDVSRYFELSSGTSPARLQVVTKPAAAWISVDGRVRGQSPLLVEDLNPGSHTVRFERGGYAIERSLTLQPGSQTTTEVRLDTERPQAASGHGLLMIATPIALQAFDGERLIGTSEASPWQLPAGRHDITLVNSSIGFRLTKPVDIEARQTTGLELRLTPATLSIDVPAETDLSIDGVAVGVGPLSQRAVAPGRHDVVARHPELGERRVRVTLAVGVPVSLKIDFAR
jgi:hypothetical protein